MWLLCLCAGSWGYVAPSSQLLPAMDILVGWNFHGNNQRSFSSEGGHPFLFQEPIIMSSEPYSLEYCGVRLWRDYVHFRFNSPGNGAFPRACPSVMTKRPAHAQLLHMQTGSRRYACVCEYKSLPAARKAANIYTVTSIGVRTVRATVRREKWARSSAVAGQWAECM